MATPVSDAERPAVRETFLARHPGAFYVDFGDFTFFRLEDVRGGRYVGGFGKVGSVSGWQVDIHSMVCDKRCWNQSWKLLLAQHER